MADSKKSNETNDTTTSKSTTTTKIEVVGPVDTASGANILRFNRDAKTKEPIDIVPGQVLTVGGNSGDITKAEADRLLSYNRWEFKEVEE